MDVKRILVIDDEKRMADSLQELLTGYDYAVDVAYSGAEGIEKLKKTKYHVAITDLRMAAVSGLDVMQHINSQTPDTLMIIITAHASTESAIEALHYKAFDYITKPFDFDLLKASVEKAFIKIEADKLREDMISMITHDIKMPLTSIIGFSNMIIEREQDNISPRIREFVNAIYLNSQKLLTLVDNFLTTCNINAGRLNVSETEVAVNPVLEDLLTIVKLATEKKDIRLDVNLGENLSSILGDENLLFRALGNVLNNAMKYTPDNGSITVHTGEVKAIDSPLHCPSLKITVTNTGPGIPRNELNAIFERYKRSKNIKGIEGSGLGLYVLKHIIEAHKGTVTVDSIPYSFTTFAVYLPLPGTFYT